MASDSSHVEKGQEVRKNNDHEKDHKYKLAFGAWLEEHVTWSWFAATQSTGGVAILLYECPKQFAGLQTIGVVVYILNLALFCLFTTLMALRWAYNPARMRASFSELPEALFFPTFWLSIATIIVGMEEYGVPRSGPWLVVAIRVLFWIYAAVTILSASVIFAVLSRVPKIKMIDFSPGMFFVIYQAMLTGTVASTIAQSQPANQRMAIIVAGVTYQGLGWIIASVFLAWFIAHLLQEGWGPVNTRPTLFIPVGLGGFTTTALIGMSRYLPTGYMYFAKHPTAAEVLRILTLWIGIFLWALSFWIFLVALIINLGELVTKQDGRWRLNLTFTNGCWGFVFPFVGWTFATIYIGLELESQAIQWVSVAMIILVVVFWLGTLFFMTKSVAMSLFNDARIKLQ